MIKISPITDTQKPASLALITAAFLTAAHADGNEAALVAALRQSPTYHPDYDVVATAEDGTLLGHALLSQAQVVADTGTPRPVFVLAPLAVAPAHQSEGVGAALISYLQMQAGEDERRAISVLGDPAYYGRFGFGPAADYGITAPFDVPTANFMIKEICQGGLANVHGELHYDPAFGL